MRECEFRPLHLKPAYFVVEAIFPLSLLREFKVFDFAIEAIARVGFHRGISKGKIKVAREYPVSCTQVVPYGDLGGCRDRVAVATCHLEIHDPKLAAFPTVAYQ